MADKLLTTGMSGNPIKLVANGDGSYSVSVSGGSGGGAIEAPKKQIWYKNRVSVPAAGQTVLLEKTTPTTIEHLEFITHDFETGAYIKIELLVNGVWENMTIMRSILNAFPNQKLSPSYLYDNPSAQWETNIHNIETNIFKYSLQKPLNAHEGIRITAMNDHDTDSRFLGVSFSGSGA